MQAVPSGDVPLSRDVAVFAVLSTSRQLGSPPPRDRKAGVVVAGGGGYEITWTSRTTSAAGARPKSLTMRDKQLPPPPPISRHPHLCGVCRAAIEQLDVGVLPGPSPKIPCFLASGPFTYRFPEPLISPWPTNVLRRTSAGASDDISAAITFSVDNLDLLHDNVVIPAVTEVVLVDEAKVLISDLLEFHFPVVERCFGSMSSSISSISIMTYRLSPISNLCRCASCQPNAACRM